MIEGEFEFSKSRQPDREGIREDAEMNFPFLEVCEADGSAAGTGIINNQLKSFSLELQSIWLPVLSLAEDNNEIHQEGFKFLPISLHFSALSVIQPLRFFLDILCSCVGNLNC